MATFQASNLTFSPFSTSRTKQPTHFIPKINYSSKPIKSALQFSDLTKSSSSAHKLTKPTRFVLDEINQLISTRPLHNNDIEAHEVDDITTSKMYAILEAVSDRIEMHNNIKEQRDNWNSLLLNSTNMITLTATLAATLADNGPNTLGLKVSSIILFLAATGILSIMSKITKEPP